MHVCFLLAAELLNSRSVELGTCEPPADADAAEFQQEMPSPQGAQRLQCEAQQSQGGSTGAW